MAEGKKSFILYCDLIHTVKKLPKNKQAELFVHILEYVNDMNPITDDMLLQIAFEPIKQSLKRDLVRYEQRAKRSRENGKKGGRPPKPKNPSGLNKNPENPTEPRKPDSVSDSVSDSVINNDVYMYELANNKERHGMFIEGLYMRHRLKPKALGVILPEFNNNLKVKEKIHKNLEEYKEHLGNWMNTQETNNKLEQYKR